MHFNKTYKLKQTIGKEWNRRAGCSPRGTYLGSARFPIHDINAAMGKHFKLRVNLYMHTLGSLFIEPSYLMDNAHVHNNLFDNVYVYVFSGIQTDISIRVIASGLGTTSYRFSPTRTMLCPPLVLDYLSMQVCRPTCLFEGLYCALVVKRKRREWGARI